MFRSGGGVGRSPRVRLAAKERHARTDRRSPCSSPAVAGFAGLLIAARRALELRLRISELPLPAPLRDFLDELSRAVPLVVEDRALDQELQELLHGMRTGKWEVYSA